MALTMSVKDELARVESPRTATRKSEASTVLRFAGGLHLVAGRVRIEATLDHRGAAQRLSAAIAELYGHQSRVTQNSPSGLQRLPQYLVEVETDGAVLGRQTGLLDSKGRPVRGLAPQVVAGAPDDAVAAWRGAFLAHGSLTEPGRSAALEVSCPGPEAALAMVGAARRIGLGARAREVRGVDRVVLRDGDAIAELLRAMGAVETANGWDARRARKGVRASANRLANFDDANLRRSARAAVAAGARVERALAILGDDVPDHLRFAGELRVANKGASLEELGGLANPPMTKDAIAGRIRRLLAMADRRAAERGIPSTEEGIGMRSDDY